MKIAIIGVGGIGAFYGAKLLDKNHDVIFVARNKTFEVLKENNLIVEHPNFYFNKKIDVIKIEELCNYKNLDLILLASKAMSTKIIVKDLYKIYKKEHPYILSLQNGVENEDILCEFLNKKKIFGGLTRKIGAYIVKPGFIKAKGCVETIIGSLSESKENTIFLKELSMVIENNDLSCVISKDIKKELWKKLIINNGVNAICALLEIKTGILMEDKKLSSLVYGLMKETANAAKAVNINISKKDLDLMFNLIKNFDSIKPSMLVDKEFNRALEIDEICGVVIKNNRKLGLDSAYTKSIAYLLEFTYNTKK